MHKNFLAVFMVFMAFGALAQSTEDGMDTAYVVIQPSTKSDPTNKDTIVKLRSTPAFKPIIGLGTGMFSFYGDLYEKKFVNPQVSRIGYELSVAQRLTPFLDLNFYVLFGKLGANERSLTRNVNFQSEIRVGGVQLMYTFANWLPGKRILHPYVTTGFESFEFLSKTDLKDKNGNFYYYWSDGSIRNLPENSPNAASAIFLQRDYTYESDVREMNLDGFGKYPERSFAVPVGVGALMHLSDRMDLRVGTTLHFTMTDYIDGISDLSLGARKGDAKKDHYLMTAFSLRYDLFSNKVSATDTLGEDYFINSEIFALDTEDSDSDGILDIKDKCLGTPPGIPVDENGCPLDDDQDGVPNPLDQELNTPLYAAVDENGVQLPDSVLALQYDMYLDSTGKYAKVVVLESEKYVSTKKDKKYTVKLGEFTTGVPSDMMTTFLSIPDIKSSTKDSVTTYTAGQYDNPADAEKRKEQLIKQGVTGAVVVMKQNDKYVTPPVIAGNPADQGSNGTNGTGNNGSGTTGTGDNGTGQTGTGGNETGTGDNGTGQTGIAGTGGNGTGQTGTGGNETGTADTASAGNGTSTNDDVVFRVQLGAYKRKISKKVFGQDDVFVFQTEDGLYKYTTGSFKTMEEAAARKVDLLKEFPDAFVVAYKGGKRVPISSVGAKPVKDEQEDLRELDKPMSTANKELGVFKVQIGVYRNEPPPEMQAKYAAIKNIQKENTTTGLTRYTVGEFDDYNKALALKNEMKEKYGIEDAFVVAFYNGQLLPVQDVLELMKK